MRIARPYFHVVGKLFQLGICLVGVSVHVSAQARVPAPPPQDFAVAVLRIDKSATFERVPGKITLTAKLLVPQKDGAMVSTSSFEVPVTNGVATIPMVQSSGALFLYGAPAGTVLAVARASVPAADFSAMLASHAVSGTFRTPDGVQFALYSTESRKHPQALLVVGNDFSSQASERSPGVGAAMVVDLPGVYAKLIGAFGLAAGGPEKFAEHTFLAFMSQRNGLGSGSGGSQGRGSFGGSTGGGNSGSGSLQCPPSGNAGGGATAGGDEPLPTEQKMCRQMTLVKLPSICDLCKKLGPEQCTICAGPVKCSTVANCVITEFELCTIKLGGGQCLTS